MTFREPDPEAEGILPAKHWKFEATEQQDLRSLAYSDALTGLPNRFLLAERLNQALARARRRNTRVGLALLDLDQFKRINDTLGHRAGDTLLQELAHRFHRVLRETDTVARFGGDEFVFLCEDLGAIGKEAASVLQRVLSAFQRPFSLDGQQWVITGSLGYTVFPDQGEVPQTLLAQADAAMYRAKVQGGGCLECFTPLLGKARAHKAYLARQGQGAVERGEFGLRFQPQVDLQTRKIVGVEALLRWHCPEQGWIPPSEFIPLLDGTGAMRAAGDWVLNTACREASRWAGLTAAPPRVAINVAADQLRQGSDLVESVEQALQASGLAPNRLELEIPETLFHGGDLRIQSGLKALKELGVRLALDDFGTGCDTDCNTLAPVQRLPVDALKIARPLVAGLAEDRPRRALLAGLIALGHALEMTPVAKGLEPRSQRVIQALGCTVGQSFALGKPVGVRQIRRKIRSAN